MNEVALRQAISTIDALLRRSRSGVVAIDGRCGSLWRNGIFPHLI